MVRLTPAETAQPLADTPSGLNRISSSNSRWPLVIAIQFHPFRIMMRLIGLQHSHYVRFIEQEVIRDDDAVKQQRLCRSRRNSGTSRRWRPAPARRIRVGRHAGRRSA